MTNTLTSGPIDWEAALRELLLELSEVQTELLAVVLEKRQVMLTHDAAGMIALEPREAELGRRLQGCHDRRRELLERATREGLPGDSMQHLAAVVAPRDRRRWKAEVQEAADSLRLLQHECLTNFVLAQRTWLHLAQMLEIIATGGRMKPTYGKGESALARGSLINEAA